MQLLTVALAMRTTQSWLMLVTSGAHFITVLILDMGSCTPLGGVFFTSEGAKRGGVRGSVLESHSELFEVLSILCSFAVWPSAILLAW